MAQSFKETAHLNTDLKKFEAGHDHVFNKAKCQCEECKGERSNKELNEKSESYE